MVNVKGYDSMIARVIIQAPRLSLVLGRFTLVIMELLKKEIGLENV